MIKIAIKRFNAVTMLLAITIICLFCSFAINLYATEAVEATESVVIVPKLNGYEIDSLPNGYVGETYPVFNGEVVLESGEKVGNADVLVLGPNGEPVAIVNGRFDTLEVGTYTIEYFAEYKAKQVSEQLEIVVVDSGYEPIQLEVLTQTLENLYSFERFDMPTISSDGGFGNLTTAWSVEYSGNNYCDKVEIACDELGEFFSPEFPGTYTWTCRVTDIVGKSESVSGDVFVTDNAIPTMQVPANSKIYHLGDTVNFTYTQAKIYDNGVAIFIPVSVFVNDLDVTSTMSFKPQTAGDYTVKYVAKNPFDQNAESAVHSYTLTVIDVQGSVKPAMYVQSFLQCDGFSCEYRENSELENKVLVLTADGSKESASLSFKNKLDKRVLATSIGFDVAEDKHWSNFSEIVIDFCDSVNAEENVNLVITPTQDNKILVVANGLYKAVINRSLTEFTGNRADNKLTFSFDSKTNSVYEDETLLFKIEKSANGKEFFGFTSGYAYFNLIANGIKEQSNIKLYSIASQIINKDATDKMKPMFLFPDDYSNGFFVDKGQKITIKKLEIFDLYSNENTISLTIQAPDKSKLCSSRNMTEDYTFEIEQTGIYIVSYTIYDASGNSRTTTVKISVVDRVSPTIEMISLPLSAKVGDTISLPACVAKDDLTETCVTYICLIKGNFQKELVYEEYKFTEPGDHFFIYGARDDAGNLTTVTYVINVAPVD